MFFNINYLSFLQHKTNHKSLYVVLGLHNVLDCGKDIGDCDHTCIIHLEVGGKQVMNHSLVRIIRILKNYVGYSSWGDVPFNQRELCFKNYNAKMPLPNWNCDEE